MIRKKFLIFLILEVLLIISVILIFKTISDRSTAGLIAGTGFISIGVYIIASLIKQKAFKSFSLYAAVVHLVFGALPLLGTRLLNWGVPHEELLILGFPAPTFHKLAEKIFTILILCTLVDLMKTFLVHKKKIESL